MANRTRVARQRWAKFLDIWNDAPSRQQALERVIPALGLPSVNAADQLAYYLRHRGRRVKNFSKQEGKKMGTGSTPGKALLDIMGKQGYVTLVRAAEEAKMPYSSASDVAKQYKLVVNAGRFRFVHMESFRSALVKHKAEDARKKAAKSKPAAAPAPARPGFDANFWSTMRAIVREELRAILKEYEVQVPRDEDRPHGPVGLNGHG